MKKRIGKLRDKLIVQGDKNLVKPYETHVKSLGSGNTGSSKTIDELIDSIYISYNKEDKWDEADKEELYKQPIFGKDESLIQLGLWSWQAGNGHYPNHSAAIAIKTTVPLQELNFQLQVKEAFVEPIIVDDYRIVWETHTSDTLGTLMLAEKEKPVLLSNYGVQIIDPQNDDVELYMYQQLLPAMGQSNSLGLRF